AEFGLEECGPAPRRAGDRLRGRRVGRPRRAGGGGHRGRRAGGRAVDDPRPRAGRDADGHARAPGRLPLHPRDDARGDAAREPRRVPRRRDQPHLRVARHHADALPPERQEGTGHQLLHQLAGRRRRRHAGDVRHHAVPDLRHRHLLHRPGRERRGDRVRRGQEGQALHPAQRQGDDPPAVRRRVRAGGGHRDPGRGDPQDQGHADQHPRQEHRPDAGAHPRGQRARPLLRGQGGRRVRAVRRGARRGRPGRGRRRRGGRDEAEV
ncbi:MAG: ATP-dependent Clp protease proteolytic subunit, partial [uncultured Phycisphaerae bacterium]